MYQKHLSLLQTMQPVMKYLVLSDAFNRLGTEWIQLVDQHDDLKIKFELFIIPNESNGVDDEVIVIDIHTRSIYVGEINLSRYGSGSSSTVGFFMNDISLARDSEQLVRFRWKDDYENPTVLGLPLQEEQHFQMSTIRDIPDMELIQEFVDFQIPDGIDVVASSLYYDYQKHSENFLEQITNLMNNGGYAKLSSHIFRGR